MHYQWQTQSPSVWVRVKGLAFVLFMLVFLVLWAFLLGAAVMFSLRRAVITFDLPFFIVLMWRLLQGQSLAFCLAVPSIPCTWAFSSVSGSVPVFLVWTWATRSLPAGRTSSSASWSLSSWTSASTLWPPSAWTCAFSSAPPAWAVVSSWATASMARMVWWWAAMMIDSVTGRFSSFFAEIKTEYSQEILCRSTVFNQIINESEYWHNIDLKYNDTKHVKMFHMTALFSPLVFVRSS